MSVCVFNNTTEVLESTVIDCAIAGILYCINLKFGDSLREGMSRDPQINSSNYILNIVELQNVVTNASGLTPLGVLTNTVGQIQEMIDYDNKRININTIAKFNEPTVPISLINDLNLCNSALYSNGLLFQGVVDRRRQF